MRSEAKWLGISFSLLLLGCPEEENGISSSYPGDGAGYIFTFMSEHSCGTPPPKGDKPAIEKIALTLNTSGSSNEEVAVMNADGSGLTVISNHPVPDGMAEWSPDGTKFAFVSGRNENGGGEGDPEIFVMNVDGTGQTQLTFNTVADENPKWSPDGTKILYTSTLGWENRITELFIMNANGSGQRRLTFHSKGLNGNSEASLACWSPDGTKILYNYRRQLSDSKIWSNELWTIRMDGSDQIRIAENGFYGFWYHNGSKIAFQSQIRSVEKDETDEFAYLRIPSSPVLMNTDGSNQDRVDVFPNALHTHILGVSPDGSQILVRDSQKGNMHIIHLSDMSIVKISDEYLQRPVWSPDGKKILGERAFEGFSNIQIWEVNADGSGEKALTPFPTQGITAYNPRWAPY